MRIIDSQFVVNEKIPPKEGGMAEVFQAYDNEMDMNPVAIKLFKDGILDINIVLKSFSQECKSLADLNGHPNIVQLVRYGSDQKTGRKYIALQWAELNLVDHLKSHPLAGWDDFYEKFGRPILDALAFAFSRGVIHRDVKPSNVLLDRNLNAIVADFGISKYRKYYKPGITLAGYGTVPYRPEIESVEYESSRDVYSFAVLTLDCLSSALLDTYDDVYESLEEADLPEPIYKILGRALEKFPEDRHSNISELLDDLDSAQKSRRVYGRKKMACPIHATNSAIETLSSTYRKLSYEKLLVLLLEDLNDDCRITRWKYRNDQGKYVPSDSHLCILTANFMYQTVFGDEGDRLVIVKVIERYPSDLERDREKAFEPIFNFQPVGKGHRQDGKETIDWFKQAFAEYESEQRVLDAKEVENQIFEKWLSLLRLKTDLEKHQDDSISYSAVNVEGNRLHFNIDGTVGDEVIEQPRVIQVGDGTVISGDIERVASGILTLYCGVSYFPEQVPSKGQLVINNRLAQTSLARQFRALDAIRYDRSARADTRRLISGQQELRSLSSDENLEFFQNELDDDKREAVRRALCSQDFLVVEGPPGTGKTKFITELILQFSVRNPDARILLSSQTNSALDNALFRARELAIENNIDLRLARIGRWDDDRIAGDVKDLVLENAVASWLGSAETKSKEFLENWANENGIQQEYIEIGMALADLRIATIQYTALNNEAKSLRARKQDLDKSIGELNKDPSLGNDYQTTIALRDSLQLDISVVEADVVQLRKKRKDAIEKVRIFPDIGDEVDKFDLEDLESLERDYIQHSDAGEHCRKLITILEEWKDRFGHSIDFHGAYLAGCTLVAGTCIGIARRDLQQIEFDLCIIDEASKASPTEMLVPISRSRKWVIVGDPLQLPPYVGDVEGNPAVLEKHDLSMEDAKATLLDHLIETLPDFAQTSLLTQHRMSEAIGELISQCFYGGRLKTQNTLVDEGLEKYLVMPKPVTWFTTSKLPNRREIVDRSGREHRNFAEVEIIERLLLRLQFAANARADGYDVVLLSGYRSQVHELDMMHKKIKDKIPDIKVEICTVDKFQGREAEIAIYSVTRSNTESKIGFLREYERLNVALSRAKMGLAIIGDSVFCDEIRGRNPFSKVLDHIRQNPADCHIEEA